jgi:uncharacterized tellurite resistance protein B-like protein
MDDSLRAELVREIQDFLESQWPPAADGAAAITERHLQLAAAVLMVLVVRADHASRPDEQRVLERSLTRALDLAEEQAAVVVRVAEEAIARGARFPALVERLARGCSTGQKHRLVEALWRIAFADAELAGEEEYLVRKVAFQLGLSTADLVETKVRAREEFLREDL